MFNKEKVQAQLEEVQGKATARTLTIKAVEQLVAIAERKAASIPVWMLKYTTFEYQETVANAYKYVPAATRVQFDFAQKGTVKNVIIERKPTRSESYGGYVRRFVLDIGMMMQNEYSLDYSYVNAEYRLLAHRLIQAYGFNHQGTMPI